MEEVQKQMDRAMAETLDMKERMQMEIEKAEKKVEASYQNMLVNNTEKINESKDAEIRKLQIQLDKQQKYLDRENTDEIRRELQLQNEMYSQEVEQAKNAEKKTMAALQQEDVAQRYYMGSMEYVQAIIGYTDEQAVPIIQQAI